MNLTKRNSLFIAIILWSVISKATTANQFIECLAGYELQVLGQNVSQAQIEKQESLNQRLPQMNGSVTSGQDFINSKNNPQFSGWSVSARQPILSLSDIKASGAQEEAVKAEVEVTKNEIIRNSLTKMELLFEYINRLELSRIIDERITTQKTVVSSYKQLVNARITDGSQMLMAESDLNNSQAQKKENDVLLNSLEKQLYIHSFFNKDLVSDIQKANRFFTFTTDPQPVRVDTQPEVKELDYKIRYNRTRLKSEEQAWLPRLDATLTYSEAWERSDEFENKRELIGGLTLTLPISDTYTRSARESHHRRETVRLENLKARVYQEQKISQETDQQALTEAKQSLTLLNNSLELLKKSRQILQKKLQLNKANYLEIAGLDERINDVELSIMNRRIQAWRIQSRWELQNKVTTRGANFACSIK